MLVLTRKSNEAVIIDDRIEVKILSVHGDQVSIGFSAPREVRIYRKEVFESIQSENRHAAAGKSQMESLKDSLGKHFGPATGPDENK